MLGNHFSVTTGDAGNAPRCGDSTAEGHGPASDGVEGYMSLRDWRRRRRELCLRREDWTLFGWRALRRRRCSCEAMRRVERHGHCICRLPREVSLSWDVAP